MAADRPSADVVAADVINRVMFMACVVGVGGTAAWVSWRAAARGDWDEVRQAAPFVLFALAFGSRAIRSGVDLLRRRGKR